jgi:hypothetical protein
MLQLGSLRASLTEGFTCTRTAVRLANRDLLLRAILLAGDCRLRLECVLEGVGLPGVMHPLQQVVGCGFRVCCR